MSDAGVVHFGATKHPTQLHERVTKNNVLHVETLVLTCAATALRLSEILALRRADILWEAERIRVSKRWLKGKDGETKTEASDGYVPLHPVLKARAETPAAERRAHTSMTLGCSSRN